MPYCLLQSLLPSVQASTAGPSLQVPSIQNEAVKSNASNYPVLVPHSQFGAVSSQLGAATIDFRRWLITAFFKGEYVSTYCTHYDNNVAFASRNVLF